MASAQIERPAAPAPGTLSVVHIASGDLWAGAEVQLFTLARAQRQRLGLSVRVVLLNGGRLARELAACGIPVTVLDESRLGPARILWRLAALLRQHRPDIVHTHRLKENVLGSLATLAVLGTPSLRTVHGAPEHPPARRQIGKRSLLALDRLCGRLLQRRIVAVSAELRQRLAHDFPLEKIAVIENGIEPPAPRQTARTVRAPTPEEPLHVVFAGRLTAVKRVDLVIATANRLAEQYPDLPVRFSIFGDGPLRDRLEAMNREQRRVSFMGHCDDMERVVEAADILLLPSDHEGLPMILLEAMRAGVAIVTHAVGGIPALLDEGGCGVLIETQSEAAYAGAIHRLAVQPTERERLIGRARERVRSRYSAETNARAYLELYRDLANR